MPATDRVQSQRRFPRWVPVSIGLTIAIAVALAVVMAFQLRQARQQLLVGLHDLQAATVEIRTQAILRQPALRRTVRADLVTAQSEFHSARHTLDFWSPLLRHLGWVPVVGSQVAAAPPAADAAFYTTNAALHLMDGLEPVWPAITDPTRTLRQQPLLARLTSPLQGGHIQFLAAQHDANRAMRALRLLPHHSGNRTLDHASAHLRRDLPLLQHTSNLLAVAPLILGARQPSHYLFAWEDPMELRATGGFIGAVDFITLYHGSITTHFAGSALPHEISSVPVPLPEAAYTYEGYWILRDSNWSPDFPLSARLERWFYGEDTGRWADGVIDFVDTGVVDILRATGPIYLPGYQRWVNAQNVVALAQHYVNGRYQGPLRQGPQDTIRKQFFGAVMQALLRRLQTLPIQQWPALSNALNQAIARRDILLYDRRPQIESLIRALHADGRILHSPGDYLYIVDDNRSYNKINPYVHERADYSVSIAPNLWLDATLMIHYHVNPSPNNLEGQGPWFGTFGSKHDYLDFLRVYVPRGAQLIAMTGIHRWAPAPAYGLTQFAGGLLIRSGHSATVTIHYKIPANVFKPLNFKRYSLTIQHQPGADLAAIHVTVQGLGGIQIAPAHSQPATRFATVLPLTRDAHLHLTMHGPTHPQLVLLPPPPARPDPYLPYAFLRDPRHPW
jgi:hypothetical protein